MNAGGHGSDIAACLTRAEIFDLDAGQATWRSAESLGLRFRGSNLADHDIVLPPLDVSPCDSEIRTRIAESVRSSGNHPEAKRRSVFAPEPGQRLPVS